MQKKVYPIMVSKYEALVRALEDGCCAIYIDRCLFRNEETRIRKSMRISGYCPSGEIS